MRSLMKRKTPLGGHGELSNPDITQGGRVIPHEYVASPRKARLSNAISISKKTPYDHSIRCVIIGPGRAVQYRHQA
jgi:hypothetical protein